MKNYGEELEWEVGVDVAKLYGVTPQMVSYWCNDERKKEFRKEKLIYE